MYIVKARKAAVLQYRLNTASGTQRRGLSYQIFLSMRLYKKYPRYAGTFRHFIKEFFFSSVKLFFLEKRLQF